MYVQVPLSSGHQSHHHACKFVKSSHSLPKYTYVQVPLSSGLPSNQLVGHVTMPQVRVMCTLSVCQIKALTTCSGPPLNQLAGHVISCLVYVICAFL